MAAKYLTLNEVAAHLRIDRKTLINWRCRGYGPRSFRAGRAVLYDEQDVTAWIAEQQRIADERAQGA